MEPTYHAKPPLETIERLGKYFVLEHFPAGTCAELAIWRARLYVGADCITAEGSTPEFAARECIQKYVLKYPEGADDEHRD
jgi:hypothetical protein